MIRYTKMQSTFGFVAVAFLLSLVIMPGLLTHAQPTSTSSGPCSYNDYGNTTNDAIYSNVADAHQGTNKDVQIVSITNYKVPNGTSGYILYSDVRVDVGKTFNKMETSPVCAASTSSGSFAVTTLLWAAFNNASQGGILQKTQGEALSLAAPSGDLQVFQAVNGSAPTGIPKECCIVSDTTVSHEYILTRVVDQNNVNLGYKIVDIHFYRVWSSIEHKYKMWADIVINSSNTYTATIPSKAVSVATQATNGVQQMRWLIVLPTGKHQLNTRAESYGGLDNGFPVIEQFVDA